MMVWYGKEQKKRYHHPNKDVLIQAHAASLLAGSELFPLHYSKSISKQVRHFVLQLIFELMVITRKFAFLLFINSSLHFHYKDEGFSTTLNQCIFLSLFWFLHVGSECS